MKRCVLGVLLCVVGACVGRDSVVGRAAPRLDTGRFTIEIAANGAGRDVLLAGEGVFDHDRHRYALTVDGRLADSPVVPRRTIAIDGMVYANFPALARRLGATTRWIRVAEDGDDVLGLRTFAPERMLEMAAATDATIERDEAGLVRRIVMRFDAPGHDGNAVLTVTYADLGAPVTIDPPPADQVTDETERVNRRTGG